MQGNGSGKPQKRFIPHITLTSIEQDGLPERRGCRCTFVSTSSRFLSSIDNILLDLPFIALFGSRCVTEVLFMMLI